MSVFTYRKAEHIVHNHHFGGAFVVVYLNHDYFRGAECAGDKFENIRIPRNNIYLFAAQLGNDCIDAHTSVSNACAHGVHFFILTVYRHFGPVTRFAHNRLYGNKTACDFRHFDFEQTLYKSGCGARNKHLGTARTRFDFFDVHFYGFAGHIFVVGRLVLRHKHCFDLLVKLDIDVIAFDAPYGTRNKLVFFLRKFAERDFAFYIAQFL